MVLAGAAMIALAVMGLLHAYLIATNQSTIELYTNRRLRQLAQRRGESWSNRYDLGIRKNFQQVSKHPLTLLVWLSGSMNGYNML
jgi:hypothetical protein